MCLVSRWRTRTRIPRQIVRLKVNGLIERKRRVWGIQRGERSWTVRLYFRPSTALQKVSHYSHKSYCLFMHDQRCRRSSCFRICRRLLPGIRQQNLSVTRCWITSILDWLRCCRVMRLPWHCVQHERWLSPRQMSLRGPRWSMSCDALTRRCSQPSMQTGRNGVHQMSWLEHIPNLSRNGVGKKLLMHTWYVPDIQIALHMADKLLFVLAPWMVNNRNCTW